MSSVTGLPEVLGANALRHEAEAAGSQEMFANTPSASSGSYALTEAADAAATG